MDREFSRLFKYISFDKNGREKRNRAIMVLIILLLLIPLNKFLFVPKLSDGLNIKFHQAKIYFLNGKSPYDSDVKEYLRNYADEESLNIKEQELEFNGPIYQLIFYFPFSLIPDYQWAASLFLTLNQICIYLCTKMLFRLLNFKSNSFEEFFIIFFGLTSFFILINIVVCTH